MCPIKPLVFVISCQRQLEEAPKMKKADGIRKKGQADRSAGGRREGGSPRPDAREFSRSLPM